MDELNNINQTKRYRDETLEDPEDREEYVYLTFLKEQARNRNPLENNIIHESEPEPEPEKVIILNEKKKGGERPSQEEGNIL